MSAWESPRDPVYGIRHTAYGSDRRCADLNAGRHWVDRAPEQGSRNQDRQAKTRRRQDAEEGQHPNAALCASRRLIGVRTLFGRNAGISGIQESAPKALTLRLCDSAPLRFAFLFSAPYTVHRMPYTEIFP